MNDYLPLSDCIRVEMADDRPISVTEHSVARKLLELNVSRASGPDNLPNWVLNNFAYILAAQMDHLHYRLNFDLDKNFITA